MKQQAELKLSYNEFENSEVVFGEINLTSSEFLGREAEFKVMVEVEVVDDRPVHHNQVIYKRNFTFDQQRIAFEIPIKEFKAYTYSGSMLNVHLHAILTIDDGLLIDTTIEDQQKIGLLLKPEISTDCKELVDPEDCFNFVDNLRSIPFKNQIVTVVLSVVGALVILVNAAIGAHDQVVPEHQTYVYSHYDSDGDSSSPFMSALALSGGLGMLVWIGIRAQLRKYMRFSSVPLAGMLTRESALSINELVSGRSRVPLERVTLRVVGYNAENGRYRRGSGTSERTVSFTEPVRAVVLYNQSVEWIPVGVPITEYFTGAVNVEPLFDALYPPMMFGGSHGISVHWEAQLLHDDFVDQELKLSTQCFRYSDFLFQNRDSAKKNQNLLDRLF